MNASINRLKSNQINFQVVSFSYYSLIQNNFGEYVQRISELQFTISRSLLTFIFLNLLNGVFVGILTEINSSSAKLN